MADTLLELIAKAPPIPPEEEERRRKARERLKKRLSSIPFYAKKDEAFWRAFHGSRILADG